MSELAEAVERVIERDICAAARGAGDRYPGGKGQWVEKAIRMAVNEINQWLNDEESVKAHLSELQGEFQARPGNRP
jgi:hypothetical protein